MKMKKIRISAMVLIVLLACLAGGCTGKDYADMVENHAAIKTYRDGVWGVRYLSVNTMATTPGITESVTVRVSLNVNGDMTEKQMLDVMDYYEFTRNASFDENLQYKGETDTNYNCYAVFYRGETDEEIRRIKYHNGKETEPAEKEKSMFPIPELHSDQVSENP